MTMFAVIGPTASEPQLHHDSLGRIGCDILRAILILPQESCAAGDIKHHSIVERITQTAAPGKHCAAFAAPDWARIAGSQVSAATPPRVRVMAPRPQADRRLPRHCRERATAVAAGPDRSRDCWRWEKYRPHVIDGTKRRRRQEAAKCLLREVRSRLGGRTAPAQMAFQVATIHDSGETIAARPTSLVPARSLISLSNIIGVIAAQYQWFTFALKIGARSAPDCQFVTTLAAIRFPQQRLQDFSGDL